MKTKFSIGYETFDQLDNDRRNPPVGRYPVTIKTIEEKYQMYYKDKGWILDKEANAFYKMFDEFINYLKIGDKVDVGSYKVVYDIQYDFVKMMVIYYLMPEPEYFANLREVKKESEETKFYINR